MAATNFNPSIAPPIPASPSGAAPISSLASTNDIRDIKPPVEIPNPWLWIWLGIVVAVLAALAFWAWRYWRKKQAEPTPLPIIPAHVRAKQKLAEALTLIHDPKPFCIAVSDAIRWYLEERYHYRAPERTTEEFLIELTSATALYPDQKQSLGEFLQSCDLVKFAKHEPTEDALHELHDSALRLVDETQFDAVEPDAQTEEVEVKA